MDSYQIHPRRLFCAAATPPSVSTPSGIDATSCVRPSIVARHEKFGSAPLLAPSPGSPAVLRTHVETRTLDSDVEILVSYIEAISVYLKGESGDAPKLREAAIMIENLSPIGSALSQLVSEITNSSSSSFVDTPRQKTSTGAGCLTDSRMLSADMAHLRTIQKQVRDLGLNLKIHQPSTPQSAEQSSCSSPQTATKISRALAQSNNNISGLLTLSPGTEIFETVRTNPWFSSAKRRSGSLPPPSREDEIDNVRTDSPISTIAPVSNREILASDESLTVSALQAAMARRRAPSGTNDLAAWMRKQAKKKHSRADSSIYRN